MPAPSAPSGAMAEPAPAYWKGFGSVGEYVAFMQETPGGAGGRQAGERAGGRASGQQPAAGQSGGPGRAHGQLAKWGGPAEGGHVGRPSQARIHPGWFAWSGARCGGRRTAG